jgi:hypothetical protein
MPIQHQVSSTLILSYWSMDPNTTQNTCHDRGLESFVSKAAKQEGGRGAGTNITMPWCNPSCLDSNRHTVTTSLVDGRPMLKHTFTFIFARRSVRVFFCTGQVCGQPRLSQLSQDLHVKISISPIVPCTGKHLFCVPKLRQVWTCIPACCACVIRAG